MKHLINLFVDAVHEGNARIRFICVATLVLLIALSAFIFYCINIVNDRVTQSNFKDLQSISRSVGKDIRNVSTIDSQVLTAMANVIATSNRTDKEYLCTIMNSYELNASYLSYIEILQPNGKMLQADGVERDVSDVMDFDKEARLGKRITSADSSTRDNAKILRNIVPVVKDGKTIYLIIGSIRLAEFMDKYRTDMQTEHLQVFLIDGTTGDFLLDTWHKSLGNVHDYIDRKLENGFSWANVEADMKRGNSGRISFTSTTLNEIVYLHYENIGVNNFFIMLMIPQSEIMEESQTVKNMMYFMAVGIGLMLLIYMCCIIYVLYEAYIQMRNMSTKDKTTGLLNRIAYDEVLLKYQNVKFKDISCIYVDVNGLHDINNLYGHTAGDRMLQVVANSIKEQFPDKKVYRVGGDEFVVLSNAGDYADYVELIRKAEENIQKQGYSIAFGLVTKHDEVGVDAIIKEADSMMLKHKSQYYITHNRRQRK